MRKGSVRIETAPPHGQVVMNVIRAPEPPGSVSAKCRKCSGLGEIVLREGNGRGFMCYQCPSCNGQGKVVWRRGISLPPLVGRGLHR